LTPEILSAAYIIVNPEQNEWSQGSVVVANVEHTEIITGHESLGKSHHTGQSQVLRITIFITGLHEIS
jgi:hypothetical protein